MKRLFDLFLHHFNCQAESCTPLTGSASDRKYFRLIGGGTSCVGVIGQNKKENKAFISFAESFASIGIPVPKVYAVSEDGMAYIQEDLGDVSLFQKKDSIEDLCKTISLLPKLQFEGGKAVDFSLSFPTKDFSSRTVMFDLNYFKYCFLKPSGLEFNEVLLQDEFDLLSEELQDETGAETFLYRDFQARNVLIKDGNPYFIDFQGGYRGPIYYDVASFIWHARASYPKDYQEKMLEAYLEALKKYVIVDRDVFVSRLNLFILLRYIQVLGAYGFRGLVEEKAKFVEAIPALMEAIGDFCDKIPDRYRYIRDLLRQVSSLPRYVKTESRPGVLQVDVCSFSFKKGLPKDYTGHGGGYIFDCRGIHNPGRYEQYKRLTGRDEAVIRFLEDDGEIISFLDHVYAVVDPHVETFSRRGFEKMMVSFGCTGGQHRSVYCAEHLAEHLRVKFPNVQVNLSHREQDLKAAEAGN